MTMKTKRRRCYSSTIGTMDEVTSSTFYSLVPLPFILANGAKVAFRYRRFWLQPLLPSGHLKDRQPRRCHPSRRPSLIVPQYSMATTWSREPCYCRHKWPAHHSTRSLSTHFAFRGQGVQCPGLTQQIAIVLTTALDQDELIGRRHCDHLHLRSRRLRSGCPDG